MLVSLLLRRSLPAVVVGALALLLTPAAGFADQCKNRGDLDIRYCDDNGDLVADTPGDPSQLLDPDPLIFSYTPVEDPSVYENVFEEFMAYLSEKTGKRVKWYGAESYAAQVEAMRSGRLHVAGISTGPTVFGVNLAGYVPFAIMAKKGGQFGYRLQLITQRDSDIKDIKDLKGRKVAHVTPSSNSGNQAPRALFKAMGVVPDKDYEVIYSGKHDNSIMGVANGDYDAAPVASSVLDRMIDKGQLKREDIRVIWQSDLFPTTSFGLAYNLKPELQKKIVDAFLTFDWKGSGLEKEFGKQADRFIPITFKKQWDVIRTIQRENGVRYTQEALAGLKVKKKKKKKN
ncbi:MAG: phosphate/phosphite/phosphonate ABC transporter substrate-binding protein [Alphaproteobacteria bacterium]